MGSALSHWYTCHLAECSQLVCGDVEVAGKYEILRFIIKDRVCTQLLQSCLTLCNPLDCSLTTSSVHGVLQARILDWVALPLVRLGIFPTLGLQLSPVSPALQVDSVPTGPARKPVI